jgi:excisionase family DNA binding protein
MNETYLTPEEAAKKFNVAAVTIRKWLRQGKLKGYKVGGTIWRIEQSELEAFVKSDLGVASNQ